MSFILKLCIVQRVSWCPYFTRCEPNHVGPVTSDAATCFSVKCGCARLQHPAPPLLPLPSHSSHPPCGGVVSGGGGVVGVPSTSEVAAYHARDTTATPAEGCVLLCWPLCFTVCSAVLCPQTVLPIALLHPQGQTTTVLQGPHPTAASHGPL